MIQYENNIRIKYNSKINVLDIKVEGFKDKLYERKNRIFYWMETIKKEGLKVDRFENAVCKEIFRCSFLFFRFFFIFGHSFMR